MLTKATIEKFFIAEKQIGFFLLIVGLIALTIAVYALFYLKLQELKWPTIIICLLSIVMLFVGYQQVANATKSRISIIYAFDMNPELIKTQELPRVEKKIITIQVLKYISVLVFLAMLWFVFFKKDKLLNSTSNAVLISFALLFLLFFSMFIFQEISTKKYAQQIKSFVSK